METDRRKALINEYKERKIVGGVYRITNARSGMYLLEYAPNIQAKHNSFSFQVSSGACFHHRLEKDWAELGGKVFTFEVLETLEKKKDESQEEFLEDLKTLAQMWSEKLDPAKRY